MKRTITLDKFTPRWYQVPIFKAMEDDEFKRGIVILPRRAGKDITTWNLIIRAALRKVGVYFYIFPTYSQAKKVIFDSITNDGVRFLDFIPPELVVSTNSQEMKIALKNGSLIQLIGAKNYDKLMGTNAQGVVFSEFALLDDPKAYQYILPILRGNDGWLLIQSTPRGKNFFYDLYRMAEKNEDWFVYRKTIDDTQHISVEDIEKDIKSGEMSRDIALQEYWVSFDMGIEGAYYARYIDHMRNEGQIGEVPWEADHRVHTAWDLGMRDNTSIIFFQQIGVTIRIIDYYEMDGEGLEHYINHLRSKPYTYGKHIAPHDIKVRELGTGMSRLEKARHLGINFELAPQLSIADGIEAVRSTLSKTWIDQTKCAQLLKALENYRKEYDIKQNVYKPRPLHNWASHACFTADTMILTRNGMRPIFTITDNTEVMTQYGWKRCLKAQKTKQNAQLVEVTFQDGTKVKCTPDHLFLTENGWKSAESLAIYTKIQSYSTNLHNISTDISIGSGQMNDILQKEESHYIGLYGNQHLEKYRPIHTFITEIITHLTTAYGIWNVSMQKNIFQFLDQIAKDFQKKLVIRLPNGIDLKLVDFGIKDMLNDVLHGTSGRESQENVSIVRNSFNASLERAEIVKNIAIPTAKHLIIENVKPVFYKEDVWDISVPGVRHFALSNGAIVHNCDAIRYMCIALPKTTDGLSPEELDKRYNEVYYGNDGHLPPFFRS